MKLKTLLTLAIVCCLLSNSGNAFMKGGGLHRPNGFLIDPGLVIFPTTGRIHTGPVLIKKVRDGGHGSGGGIDIMNELTEKMEGVSRYGSNTVEDITREFGNILDGKLKSIQDNLEPIKETLGQLAGGAGLGGGSGGGVGGNGGGLGGGLGGKFGGLADGLLNEVQNKLGGVLGQLSGGGPLPLNEGHQIVYLARIRNNRHASHPPKRGKPAIHHRPMAINGLDRGPKWVQSQCPDVYVGVGFTPDPCPGQAPPCGEDGCNQAIGLSSGGWA